MLYNPDDCQGGQVASAIGGKAVVGKEILPDEVTTYAGDKGMYDPSGGSSHEITRVLAEHYSLQFEDITGGGSDTEKIERISKYLRDGWMIHTSGQGSEPFSAGGHYIGIRGITSDGKWLIADSKSNGEENTLRKEWKPQDIFATDTVNANGDRFTRTNEKAIKK